MLHDGGNMNHHPATTTKPPQHQQHQQQLQQQPSIEELREMAARQQQQIEEQQQLLVAKEQRLKYLKQQEYQQHQMASEYDKLRRLRDKVEVQELKLRKLRALRGQADNINNKANNNVNNANNNSTSLSTDLESIRRLFNEKEKELAMAVTKVDDLTRQLEELRNGKLNYNYPPQVVELEKLRRELAYRRQLNEQQNNMISQQRAQLSLGQEEMARIDRRIAELQDRLTRKRIMNQQLANQINAATSAKQAQLRAIQAGLANKNNNNNINNINNKSNKPVSTVEPFQRTIPTSTTVSGSGGNSMLDNNHHHLSADDLKPGLMLMASAGPNSTSTTPASNATTNINSNNNAGLIMMDENSGGGASNKNAVDSNNKYQTLPYNTKFGQGPPPTVGNSYSNQHQQNKLHKIEQLKLEKENNNVGFSDGLPRPPPPMGSYDYQQQQQQQQSSMGGVGVVAPLPSHSATTADVTTSSNSKPVSSVAPVFAANSNSGQFVINTSQANQQQLSNSNYNNNINNAHNLGGGDLRSGSGGGSLSPTKLRPALPPKPYNSNNNSGSIGHHPVHGEEGTSVDDEDLPPPPPTTEPPSDSPIPSSDSNSLTSDSVMLPRSHHHQIDADLSVSVISPVQESSAGNGGLMVTTASSADQLNSGGGSNVHVSINRRIEMPPAFHFPEDEAPPSDLISSSGNGTGNNNNNNSNLMMQLDYNSSNAGNVNSAGAANASAAGSVLPRDVTDNFPMVSQMFKEFHDLGFDEKEQLFMGGSGGGGPPRSPDDESDEYSVDTMETVPEFESTTSSETIGVKSIIEKSKKGNLKITGKTRHNRKVSFDPLALLLDASLEGELELVRKTAHEVANPSAANDEGITALHNAICAGHLEIVEFLVMFGCDVNAQDSDGWTPLHCAASCNNLAMVKFLVEHGACIFATTLSDHETAAEKCEEDEEGFDGCSEYLYHIQEKLGIMNDGVVYTLYRYDADNSDELSFEECERLVVLRKGDEIEKDWWWASRRVEGSNTTANQDTNKQHLEGYIPRNLVGLYPRVNPGSNQPMEE